MNDYSVDVAIIGGGPAGSTCATYLRKYAPELSVMVVEREAFPRDHVGESLLPPISYLLNEMGCYEAVEEANFPIKIGATYKWGKSSELWDFEFFPSSQFVDEPRPAPFSGQRLWTAFQVDRSIFDGILLNNSVKLGAELAQPERVIKIETKGDFVERLILDSGKSISARFYVDASGHSGILRRAMGVETSYATSLQNIAVWDYWQNADWAVNIGVGATRVQVMSLGYGWIWFIPLGPTRTSVGLVMPAEYYKSSGLRPEELYRQALKDEPSIAALMKNAECEGKLNTTKDWSFISERTYGQNWYLTGEACGFADPILAAGMSLTMVSAREAAISIIESIRGTHDLEWLKSEYAARQHGRLRSHIRFAEYWYSANTHFTDLKDFTQQIAAEGGLDLTPDKAWAWLAQGGFVDYDGNMGIAGFATDAIKGLGEFLSELGSDPVVKTNNCFSMNLDGAELRQRAHYGRGKISAGGCYVRGDRVLPVVGVFEFVLSLMSEPTTLTGIIEGIKKGIADRPGDSVFINEIVGRIPHALEALVADGWVTASFDPKEEMRDLPERVADVLHWNRDNRSTLVE